MADFEQKYKIKPIGKVKQKMDAYEENILKRNPELKDNIIIPEGKL